MLTPVQLAAVVVQFTFVVVGCVLFWRHVASAAGRRALPALPAWNISPADFILFLFHVLGGGFIGSAAVGLVRKPLGIDLDHAAILATAAAHLGMLGGIAAFSLSVNRRFSLPFGVTRSLIASGIATFLIALPFVMATGFIWGGLLKLCGLPVERQLAVELFARLKSTPWLIFMATTAVILAPLTEELIFRAGFFRFFRTRLPRWAVLALPSCLFAAAHQDLATFGQLAVLGVTFSLAYERTGNIAVPMIAHAVFNLNMVILLLTRVAN